MEQIKPGKPENTLSIAETVMIIVGIVVGAGIFKTPSLVAANSGSGGVFLMFWIAGGVASLIGALCYAELATSYPNTGGDYHFLTRAYGQGPGFLFAWARMAVIQSGSIAMLAFLLGDYLSEVLYLGAFSGSVYAALVVVLLTLVNMAGIRSGARTQFVFTLSIIAGLLFVVGAGLLTTPAVAAAPQNTGWSSSAFGMAMIFVLLTYGGWNEAAYLSAELKDSRRNMIRVMLYSIGAITLIYLLINFAFLRSMGLAGMTGSEVVAADLMRMVMGDRGARFISLLIAITVLSSINGSIITGARTTYSLGRDFPLLAFLGQWHHVRSTPTMALGVQAFIALLLIGLGTATRGGFVMMVEYTAPVFWFFLLLVGLSLFVLRHKDANRPRPFTVPLYPLTPLLFCGICGYMLYSSIMYTEMGALLGVAVLFTGLPLLYFSKDKKKRWVEVAKSRAPRWDRE